MKNVPPAETEPSTSKQSLPPVVSRDDQDRPHVQHIPRPPEWDRAADRDDESESETDESDEDTEYEEGAEPEDDTQPEPEQSSSSTPAERGILLSFPHLELHGIELLELTSLHITVKCERCKDVLDVERLRSDGETSKQRELRCKKCANSMAARFRGDLIHANSVRGGYLDLDGCTVVDMLPRCVCSTAQVCLGHHTDSP